MDTKAFDLVASTLEEALSPQGFVRQEVEVKQGEEMVALYIGDGSAYSVFYDLDKKRFELRTCGTTTDGNPDNKWKAISVWLFDPETDGMREAEGIGEDFAETIRGPKRTAAMQAAKKKKKDDDGNVDPLFFMNRLVNVFLELKEEIVWEKEHFEKFRGVTFTETKALPKIQTLINDRWANQDKLTKLAGVLSDCYSMGDLDVRGLITIVILNRLEGEGAEQLREKLSDELKKSWKTSARFKNKEFKPEKKKKEKKKFMAQTLNSR